MKRKDSKGRALRNNEYQRKDGRYAYQYTDVKGCKKQVYSWRLLETDPQPKDKPSCDSLRTMEKAIQKDISDGIETNLKVTLNERWDMYIADRTGLKESTRSLYRYNYDKFVRDDIGRMAMKDITYSKIKTFFSDLLNKKGLKIATLSNVYELISPVMRIAVRDGLIRINPASTVMKELKMSNEYVKPKRHALTETEQIAFINYVASHPKYSKWLSFFTCLLGTGCRIAEMLGLRWCDILWAENTISINHNLITRLHENGLKGMWISTTKTENGNRLIPMFESVRNALKEEYKRQEKEGFCKTVVDDYSGFIWMDKHHEVLIPGKVNCALEYIVKCYNTDETAKAEAEHREPVLMPHISAHTFRHTFCVRLCENETDLKLIQEIMGHADISTTMNIYNESNIERKKKHFALLEKMSAVF